MKITQDHVSAGCNKVVGALDWGDRLVAYAAHNLVCLYDAEVGATLYCLHRSFRRLINFKLSPLVSVSSDMSPARPAMCIAYFQHLNAWL